MRSTLAIARKELSVYFTTPIAYVVFTVVALFASLFFTASLEWYRNIVTRISPEELQQAAGHLNLTEIVVAQVFRSAAVLLWITAPFLSMRLIAEEKRARTFELLLTSPVRPSEIVAGKYLAALAVMTVSIALVATLPVILSFFAKGVSGGSALEWQTVGTGLLGLFLFGAMCLAVGMFISAVTESVIVAALVTFIVLFALWWLSTLAMGLEGPLKDLTLGLSASEHLGAFMQGRIELKDVVYYLSFVALGLWLTDRAVEGHRWA